MTSNADHPQTDTGPNAYNYCVSFIDLLGHRSALRGQGLLPPFNSEEERRTLNAMLRNSIGAIVQLQQQAEHMLGPLLRTDTESPLRTELTPEQQKLWDEMQHTRISTQRWSDGLVSFTCLGDHQLKCRMNGVYGLFGLAGALCLIGLATRRPVRGAIDVAWGVELHQGELYGAAIARAYELESEIAQYPRIVVGEAVLTLLRAFSQLQETDVFSHNNRVLAKVCLGMLHQDADGRWILHYLGKEFQDSITQDEHPKLCALAYQFIVDQLAEHSERSDMKLASRYATLKNYFEKFPIAG